MIRIKHTAQAWLALSVLVSTAFASENSFVGAGQIESFGATFGGADLFPFVGESESSPVSFAFHFDADAAPAQIVDGIARFELDGQGSHLQLGASTITFDTIVIGVGTTSLGQGFLSFGGANATLGVNAGVQLESPDPLDAELPTSIDLSSFTSFREFLVDSNQNQFLLPIVLGTVVSAEIVPAPGVCGVLGIMAAFTARRRR